jgi:hypothetical protein
MKSILMSSKLFRVFLLITSVFAIAPLAAVSAQDALTQSPQKEVAGNNLEPFAEAYKEVSQIHTTYEQRIIKSDDPSQVDVLQQEANQKMNQAVTSRGLTIEDYNMMFQNIKEDPALKEEFLTVLRRTQQ